MDKKREAVLTATEYLLQVHEGHDRLCRTLYRDAITIAHEGTAEQAALIIKRIEVAKTLYLAMLGASKVGELSDNTLENAHSLIEMIEGIKKESA